VVLLHDPLLVDASGQARGSWAIDAGTGDPSYGVRPTATKHAQSDHRGCFPSSHALDRGKIGRLDAAQLVGHVFQLLWRPAAANKFRPCGYAEKHEAALGGWASAQTVLAASFAGHGSLELHPVGLAPFGAIVLSCLRFTLTKPFIVLTG